jgi:hypothetical protein
LSENENAKRTRAINILRKDFELYSAKCLRIKTKAAKIVPLVFNRAQRKFVAFLLHCLVAGIPIRCIILKARQLGFSTIIAAFFYWVVSMNPNRGALVVAHDLVSARNLFAKTKLFYKCSPSELRPMRKNSNRTELYFANPDEDGQLGLESHILVATADNEDLGASFTLQLAHLSEFARYEKVVDVKAMMTSLNQAIPELPGTAKIIETTALGEGYFKDMWDAEDNGYEKIFISWLADDSYRIEVKRGEYLELSDVEDTKYGNEVVEAAAIRQQVIYWYPEWKELTTENLKNIDHEVMCRIMWRRWAIDNLCEHDKTKFRQEYPTTPEDAFSLSGTGIFDQRRLSDRKKQIKQAIAEGIIKPIKFRYSPKASQSGVKDWWRRAFYQAGYGNLTVYEEPLDGFKYVIGADPSDGLIEGGDNAAACVLRCPDLKQVAMWAKPIEPDEFADLLYALGMLYNKALLGVEVENMGRATILRLAKDLFYPNLFYRMTQDDITTKRLTKFGWYTTQITKPIMISAGQAAIREDDIQLLDIQTIEEMQGYKRHDDGSYGAPQGKHDDCVMATLIAIQMAKQIHINLASAKQKAHRFSLHSLTRQIDRAAGKTGLIGYGDFGN